MSEKKHRIKSAGKTEKYKDTLKMVGATRKRHLSSSPDTNNSSSITLERRKADFQIHKVCRQISELTSPKKCGSLRPEENQHNMVE